MNTDLEPPLLPSELKLESPDPLVVREQFLLEFVRHTGQQFANTEPSSAELRDVSAWLNKHADTFLPELTRHRRVLVQSFFSSLSSKASSLAQFHCPLCSGNGNDGPVWTIPIRIPPISKQAASQAKGKVAAFERAIASRFTGGGPWLGPADSVCLLLVFVVHPTAKRKDLDNMAKAIVDAVKSILFGDDRQIDHLNLIRLKAPGEEYVYINLRKSRLNDHSNVLLREMHHSWAGAQVLDLSKFM
jgi:Endodeoxyribonuclease RusA